MEDSRAVSPTEITGAVNLMDLASKVDTPQDPASPTDKPKQLLKAHHEWVVAHGWTNQCPFLWETLAR